MSFTTYLPVTRLVRQHTPYYMVSTTSPVLAPSMIVSTINVPVPKENEDPYEYIKAALAELLKNSDVMKIAIAYGVDVFMAFSYSNNNNNRFKDLIIILESNKLIDKYHISELFHIIKDNGLLSVAILQAIQNYWALVREECYQKHKDDINTLIEQLGIGTNLYNDNNNNNNTTTVTTIVPTAPTVPTSITSGITNTVSDVSGESDESDECKICFDGKITHIIIPCGHMMLCDECASKQYEKCPQCRKDVMCVTKVFK